MPLTPPEVSFHPIQFHHSRPLTPEFSIETPQPISHEDDSLSDSEFPQFFEITFSPDTRPETSVEFRPILHRPSSKRKLNFGQVRTKAQTTASKFFKLPKPDLDAFHRDKLKRRAKIRPIKPKTINYEVTGRRYPTTSSILEYARIQRAQGDIRRIER